MIEEVRLDYIAAGDFVSHEDAEAIVREDYSLERRAKKGGSS